MVYERQREPIDQARLVDELRRGFPTAPGGLSEDEFARLCDNLARAIMLAVASHETQQHSPEPEFGEEERAG